MSRSEPTFRAEPHALRSSLRLRLTLLIIAVFAVIQVTLTIVRLMAMRKALDDTVAGRLLDRTEALTKRLSESDAITPDGLRTLALTCDDDTLFDGTRLEVFGPGETGLASEPMPPGLWAVQSKVREEGQPIAGETKADTDAALRYAARRFQCKDGTARVLLVTAFAPSIDRVMAEMSRVIVISTPIGLAAAALGAWFVAGVAVRPLTRLRQIAQHLGPESIGENIQMDSTAREVRRLQDELNSAMRRLDAGYQAQERFIANVSHEIKTPIATVLTEAQTLGNRAALPENVRQFLGSAEEEMRRLGQQVESFLLLARVRDGKGIFTVKKRFEVNELVMEAVEHCAQAAKAQGVSIAPHLLDPETQEVHVHGDPALLRTLMDNLIRNAIRFSPAGKRVEVTVSIAGQRACVGVRDQGPGIPPDVMDHVFDRFSHVKSEQRLGRGSGLGLEIAKGIAEIHGGDIEAQNCPDGGCLFTASLPISTGAAVATSSTPDPCAAA